MKKIFKLMLVLALVVTQFIGITSVSAAETTGKITINATTEQTKDGAVTYNIYKIFDLSLNEDGNAYRYTIKGNSPWYAFFKTGAGKDYVTLTPSVAEGDVAVYVVTWNAWADGMTDAQIKDAMAKLAKDALTYVESNSEITAVKTATIAKNGTTAEVTGLELGYYLVDSSLGSLCALDTTNREVTINEKNTVPTVDKKIVEGENRLEESYSQIGDVVEYETTITVAAGAKNYTLYDDMELGLTYNGDAKVYVNDVEVAAAGKFTVTTPENHTFVIAFANSYIDTLEVGTNIVVKYSATLNKDAEISTDSNDNTTYLIYGDSNKYTTVPEKTKTYSFKFDLVKTDVDNNILVGAEFKLYDSDKTTEIPVVKLEDGTYRVATGNEEGVAIKAGYVTIKGLDGNTTYYLLETVAPEGYNKLTDFVTVSIGTANLNATITLDQETEEPSKYVEGGIKVVNNTGTELPSTGGMGTVMFITIGSLMVMGFGVLLVTKFRLSKES